MSAQIKGHPLDLKGGVVPHCCVNGVESVSAPLSASRPTVYSWNFNVFEYAQRKQTRPLFHVTIELLEKHGLLDGWKLKRPTVVSYFTEVENMYIAKNPYHNNTHAADVTQTAGVIMRSLDCHLRSHSSNSSDSPGHCSSCSNANGSGLVPGLSKIERFSIILSAAVHDLGHPGVNNVFLVRTRDEQAITYNDKSVNEMMHVSLAFKLALDNPELNLFEGFTEEEYELVRKLVVDMVLSTDMDSHFKLLTKFDDALVATPDVRAWSSYTNRSLLFQMVVHLADLANPSRPWNLALQWAEWVVTEFLQQGEREAAAGIPVTDMCNRDKVCMPAAQLYFIQNFMQPTLEAFAAAAPSFAAMALPWLEDTKGRWATLKAAGVKLPGQGYVDLPPLPAHLSVELQEEADCCQQQCTQ